MAIIPKYPGVYVEELPSNVRPIVGVATSITAFVGAAARGPTDTPVLLHSWGDFERRFGGLSASSTMSYAVSQYYQNGGTDALIVRVVEGTATPALFAVAAVSGGTTWVFAASSAGKWGDALRLYIDHVTKAPTDASLFNLRAELLDADGTVLVTEQFYNLSTDVNSADWVERVLEEDSKLVVVDATTTATTIRPQANTTNSAGVPTALSPTTAGSDGGTITDTEIIGSEGSKTGMWSLLDADLFSILCLPSPSRDGEATTLGTRWAEGLRLCQRRRAILLVDPLTNWTDAATANAGMFSNTGTNGVGDVIDKNAALFFPRLKMPDPLLGNRPAEFAPCGVVAGVIARTDAERGIWKAPAGIDARVRGARGLSVALTDDENGDLNPLGLNCLRAFPGVGTVVWGSRTIEGADLLASQWKYLPVRRTALYIEETLARALRWVVFEPNDAPLWAQIRLNVGAFMHSLFRQGAFQGKSPQEAYLVKCDGETTIQDDIDKGIVNIVVGFAPLKPAEFVMIKMQQITAQAES